MHLNQVFVTCASVNSRLLLVSVDDQTRKTAVSNIAYCNHWAIIPVCTERAPVVWSVELNGVESSASSGVLLFYCKSRVKKRWCTSCMSSESAAPTNQHTNISPHKLSFKNSWNSCNKFAKLWKFLDSVRVLECNLFLLCGHAFSKEWLSSSHLKPAQIVMSREKLNYTD